MRNTELANLVNYKKEKTTCVKNKRLKTALDTLSELFGIEFGSVTIKFHEGKWSPKIQIEKRLVEEVKE
ncbi:MAG: hypothetical protein AB7H97_00075 [Pseudobdellovibrionaceae bacterium]